MMRGTLSNGIKPLCAVIFAVNIKGNPHPVEQQRSFLPLALDGLLIGLLQPLPVSLIMAAVLPFSQEASHQRRVNRKGRYLNHHHLVDIAGCIQNEHKMCQGDKGAKMARKRRLAAGNGPLWVQPKRALP
jgi:hypothetical protein